MKPTKRTESAEQAMRRAVRESLNKHSYCAEFRELKGYDARMRRHMIICEKTR